MDDQEGIDQLQIELRGIRDPAELHLKVEALVNLLATGDEISAAIEVCEAVLRRADEIGLTREHSLQYAVVLMQCLNRRGAIAEASTLAREILKRVSSPGITNVAAATAICAVATVCIAAGESDRAEELLHQAQSQVVGSGNVDCLATYYTVRGHLSVRSRAFSDAASYFQTAAALYHLVKNAAKEGSTVGHSARAHMLARRFNMAAEIYSSIIQREGLTRKAWVTIAVNYSICLLCLGKWGKASSLLEKAQEEARSIGLLSDESRVLTIMGHIALRRSELDKATQLAGRALTLARENSLLREELAALECLGETEHERGNAKEALGYYAECIAKGEAVSMTDAITQGKRREAEAWNALGEYEKARAAADRCIEVAATNEDRLEHAAAHRPLGIAHSLLGDREAAEGAFQKAVEGLRTLGEPFELAKTLVELACHLRDSDPTTLALGAAAGHLREARELFAGLRATRWQERVDRELEEAVRLLGGTEEAPAVQTAAVERGVRSFKSVTILTRSHEIRQILEHLAGVAPSTLPILITGESGTGKELFARAVLELSGRPAERFVAVNCAALPKELHESELFGHVKGSFTGATSEKPGLFEQADGGTIFLDEIGDLHSGAQGMLLRVLEDGELRRVGETKTRRVDVRVVAATNRDLEQSVREGTFRRDLYHRLNGLLVRIPSLRERPEDIEALATHFIELFQRQYGKRVQLSQELMALYKSYSWQGNVRELRQELHRMVLLTADGETMRPELSQVARLAAHEQAGVVAQTSGYTSAVNDHERRLILDAMRRAAGNKAQAARFLNMSRTTLIGKIRRLGLE